MGACCVIKCKNRSEKKEEGITFHRFPVDEKRKNVWIRNMNIQNWLPSQHDRICSDHFEEKWFYGTEKTRRLLAQAVPTIFPTSPAYLQNSLQPTSATKRRRKSSSSTEKQSDTEESEEVSSTLLDTPTDTQLEKQLTETNVLSETEPQIIIKLEERPQLGDPEELGSGFSTLFDSSGNAKLKRQLFRAKLSSKKKSEIIKKLKQSLKRSKKRIMSLKQKISVLQTQNLLLLEDVVLNNDNEVKDKFCNENNIRT